MSSIAELLCGPQISAYSLGTLAYRVTDITGMTSFIIHKFGHCKISSFKHGSCYTYVTVA